MHSSNNVVLPVLPLRETVIFPHSITHLFVGRDVSVAALMTALQKDHLIFLLAQAKEVPKDKEPTPLDLCKVGTVCKILETVKLNDNTWRILVKSLRRGVISECEKTGDYLQASVDEFIEQDNDENDVKAISLRRLVEKAIVDISEHDSSDINLSPEVISNIKNSLTMGDFCDRLSYHLKLPTKQNQKLLEEHSCTARLQAVYEHIYKELGVIETQDSLQKQVKAQMAKTQKQYYLNEQLKAIQKELGEDGDPYEDEIALLEKAIKNPLLPAEVAKRAKSEFRKLKMSSPSSAESTVIRNYLDWLLKLPWNKYKKKQVSLDKASEILNKDHYGLEKVKDRILEHLAMQQRKKSISGSVICLKGPPGVGKTSLGYSIAAATGRKFVRVSLGGVRDEAEIRGHRRTYIGAMPGRIIQAIKKAQCSNPLILLDEIDKLVVNMGDPAAALLEVLDPEQNKSFSDHYIELDFDLSKIMFVCTANTFSIPSPLLDRMEIINISGYTRDEKFNIGRQYLMPKQIEKVGLKKGELTISDGAMSKLIADYTREAGVRQLEREINKIARKINRDIVEKKLVKADITCRNLEKYAGPRKYEDTKAEKVDMIGVTGGLAWTEMGGEILLIETIMMPGKGKITLTGKLGDVMKESIQAAWSYIKSQAAVYGLKNELFTSQDAHVHVPEGATPKDGPSAGIAMVTSIVSVLAGIPVKCSVAMTGEITLRGRVLPIGGLKEKLIAAHQNNIKMVLIPYGNKHDLEELPPKVRRDLNIVPVKHISEVLSHALTVWPLPSTQEDKLKSHMISGGVNNDNKDVSGIVCKKGG